LTAREIFGLKFSQIFWLNSLKVFENPLGFAISKSAILKVVFKKMQLSI
jgi:hypothetical protein